MTHTPPATTVDASTVTRSTVTASTVTASGAFSGGGRAGVRLVVGVEVYAPGRGGQDGLDTDLAELAYRSVAGWPDQRPITAALVRSRLRPPPGARDTLLATVHLQAPVAAGAGLIGAAALRWPQDPAGPGRLWGPVVHPDHRCRGLGRALLQALTDPAHLPAGTRLATAEIPARRQEAMSLFSSAGWIPHSRLILIKGPLPLAVTAPSRPRQPGDVSQPPWSIRSARTGEDLTRALAGLYAAARPGAPEVEARHAWARWSLDERFTPACLALATLPHRDPNELVGAALVYPLTHTDPVEPTEALLGDLLIHPGVHWRLAGTRQTTRGPASAVEPAEPSGRTDPQRGSPDLLRRHLVTHALNQAHLRHERARHGQIPQSQATLIARAIVAEADGPTRRCLDDLGLRATSTMTTFHRPTRSGAAAGRPQQFRGADPG